jgi:hypothetical protein
MSKCDMCKETINGTTCIYQDQDGCPNVIFCITCKIKYFDDIVKHGKYCYFCKNKKDKSFITYMTTNEIA